MALMLAKGMSALLPVAAHLAGLLALDGYKLVKLRMVFAAILCGVVAAVLSNPINNYLLVKTELDLAAYSAWVAPWIEEGLKSFWLVYLLASRRLGFLVDAAIVGFAVGVGFALYENSFFLYLRPEAGLGIWIIRGFGTAVMHGSTMALFGILTQGLCEKAPAIRPWYFLPGAVLAVAVHSVFNQFWISPVLSAAGLVLGVPLLMYLVFRISDRNLQKWLGTGFDTDGELLEAINRGRLSETPVGTYLLSLQKKFPPETVADMFCLLRISVELSLEAKGLLLMRKQGFDIGPSDDIQEKLAEVAFLEKSIGPTGRLAVGPLLPGGRKDFWQRQLLG